MIAWRKAKNENMRRNKPMQASSKQSTRSITCRYKSKQSVIASIRLKLAEWNETQFRNIKIHETMVDSISFRKLVVQVCEIFGQVKNSFSNSQLFSSNSNNWGIWNTLKYGIQQSESLCHLRTVYRTV